MSWYMQNKIIHSFIHNTTQYELGASTFRVEDTVRRMLWNTDMQVSNYMVSQPTKIKQDVSPNWIPVLYFKGIYWISE